LQVIVHPRQVSRLRYSLASVASIIVIILSLSATVMIIPQANEWDHRRQLLSSFAFEHDSYPTTTFIVSDYGDDHEMTNPDHALTENDPYQDDGIYATTVVYSKYTTNYTTFVVD